MGEKLRNSQHHEALQELVECKLQQRPRKV